MSDTQLLWIALVISTYSPLGIGQELVAPNYQRLPFPLPADNGEIPNLSIGSAAQWPTIVGWQVWDDPVAGNYLYGSDLLWPLGPGGGFTLMFDGFGVASQLDPETC